MSQRHAELTEPGPTVDGLLLLAADLDGLGVTVPRADDFLDRAMMPGPGAPTPPTSILDATDEELHTYARELAVWRLTADRTADTANELARALCVEYAALVRDHADSIVDALRPDFAAGIEAARQLRALGVTETDTPATLITRDPDVIAAWNKFRTVTAPALEQIAEARIDLTRVAGVPPERPCRRVGRRDWGMCFNVTEFDRPDEEAWARWVRLAPSAELPAPSTITQLAELAHSNIINPDLVAAVAADRHRQRTQTTTDTDD